jgi:hypothetical protein
MAAKIALLEVLFEQCEKERAAYEEMLRIISDRGVCLHDPAVNAMEVLERFDCGEVAAWRNQISKIL